MIAGVLGKEEVLCSSKSFFESIEKPSTFCTISGEYHWTGWSPWCQIWADQPMHKMFHIYAGVAYSYLLLQITLWGTFHALGLCRGIMFPFYYRRFKTEGRIKYVHVIIVILGLVLPAISALVPLVGGYTITSSKIGDHCFGRNTAITFFTN